MKGLPAMAVAVVLMWVAAVLDQAMSYRLAVFGCAPSFLLAVVGPMALLSRASFAGGVGFASGLIQGALAGANLTHYVISRSIAGFLTSLGGQLDIRLALPVAGLACAATTIVSQLLLMFLAPPPGSLVGYVFGSIGMAIYNGLIGIPIYALLRKIFVPKIIGP
jgi:hypothetical protein